MNIEETPALSQINRELLGPIAINKSPAMRGTPEWYLQYTDIGEWPEAARVLGITRGIAVPALG